MSYRYNARGACNCFCTVPAMFFSNNRCYDTRSCEYCCSCCNSCCFYRSCIITPRSAGDDGVNYVYNLPTEALRGDSDFYLHITSAGSEGRHPVVFYINGTTYPLSDATGRPVTADLSVEGSVWNIARIEICNEIRFHTINFISSSGLRSDKGRSKLKDAED